MKSIATLSAFLLFTFSASSGVLLEDFDNGNLGEWTEFLMGNAGPGSWKIVNDELHAVSPDNWTRLLTIGDATWENYTLEFDVKPLKKPGRGHIAIAARINGDWAVWCMIGDHPFPDNISQAMWTAGNFRNPTPLILFDSEPHPLLGMKQWSTLKLRVKGNTLDLWINGKPILERVVLPNRETFERFDAHRKQHLEEHHANDANWRFRPMELGDFQDFSTGGVGLGLANQTARFDNVRITGDTLPNSGEFWAVTPGAKLATQWGHLKRF